MPDPYHKLIPGDPFQPSAQVWNRMIDAANLSKQGAGLTGGTGGIRFPRPGDVLVRNASTDDLERFSVVVPTPTPIFDPHENPRDDEDPNAPLEAFQSQPCLNVSPPFLTSDITRFLILQDSIPHGEFGLATRFGMTPVKLDVVSTTDRYAVAILGDYTRLRTQPFGGARIEWKPNNATGEQWGFVSIAPLQRETFFATLTDREDDGDTTYYSWREFLNENGASGELNAIGPRGNLIGTIVNMGFDGTNYIFSERPANAIGRTKEGGIPGKAGAIHGLADVDFVNLNGGVLDTQLAYNRSTAPVAGNTDIMLKYVDGIGWLVDWEECGGS